MGCGPEDVGGVYRPRQPQQSPFYRLVERFYPQFEAVYEERYQECYGFWRPIIGTVVFPTANSCSRSPGGSGSTSGSTGGFWASCAGWLRARSSPSVAPPAVGPMPFRGWSVPFSQARMIEVTEAGKVIVKAGHNAVGRFPEPGDEGLAAGPSRNFQVFGPLDLLR